RVALGGGAVAAAARRLDDEAVALAQRRDDLRGDDLLAAAAPPDEGARQAARIAAVMPGGGAGMPLAAIGEGDLALEDLVLEDAAEPAALAPGPARIAVERGAVDADRRIHHQRLGRHVHAVGGIGLDGVDAVAARRGAAAAGQELRGDEAAEIRPPPA